ncbi:hypothetical protein M8J76_015862 [Diaphorina citri]|nr:hypothetical protein M8J75_005031 [Diaphorina citri]KAI5750472.1 hypothetical protein M8J76_015862 [Diaphorina citri]KAI5753748.1 hypothetical protein M8J77_003031 [Diaphorina citri]
MFTTGSVLLLLIALCQLSSEVECVVEHHEDSVEDEVPHFIPVEESYTSSSYVESDESNVNDSTDPVPPDLKTVSKFIQEFHKKIEGDSGSGKMLASTADDQVPMGFFSGIEDNEGAPISPLLPYYPLRHMESMSNSTGNSTNSTSTTPLVNCDVNFKYNGSAVVEIVNTTRFIQILKSNPNITMRSEPAACLVALFYARSCPFSAMAAPHYNALPRAFPSMKMVAVNAMKHQIFNTQFGIVGVPTVLLFHNGRPAAKFNTSEYTLEQFARFITRFTGWKPEKKMFVTSADFGGPVPSVPLKETDKWLFIAWLVVIVCSLYGFTKTRYWHWFVESAKNTWREAEAAEENHEHND